jgi:D-alanyl-D-alanine carboxypeptidase (penicillin-binding protein 5/6)
VEPASITKLMTAYVVFHELSEGNIGLGDAVSVSEKAWRTGGSRMFIEPDMQVSVEDLLRGIVIQSGNDASVALAEYVAGSEEAFADLMNHYAELLGMINTNFTNSTGLPDPDHYTTAFDIALLSAATIRDYPGFYTWYSEKEFTFNNIRQHNRNTLLWRDPAIDGLKTGHTEAAGYCLAASAKRDGMRLISAVMGSSSESSRAAESQSLLNYGFRFFETVQLYQADQELSKARIWKGLAEEVTLGIGEDLFVTIPRGRYDDLEAKVEMQPQLTAPIEAGVVVGTIRVQLGEEVIASRELRTLAAVEEAGFFGSVWDSMELWIDGLMQDDEQEPESE